MKKILCLVVILFVAICALTACKESSSNNNPDLNNNPQGLEFYLLDDDTYAVSMGNAKYLSNITFPSSYNGKTVTRIVSNQSVFAVPSDYRHQKTITIPDTITHIEDYAFEFCVDLKSIELPSGLLHIGDKAFYGCFLLSNIAIPDSVITIGNQAFGSCTSLAKISIPNSVTDIASDAFSDCAALEFNEYDNAFYLGNDDNPYIVLMEAKSQDILSCNINSGTKHIFSRAFYYCKSLSAITLPEGLISIGDWAFSECSSLVNINIPNSVTKLGAGILSYCSSLAYNEYENALYLGNEDNPYVLLMNKSNWSATSYEIHNKTKFIHSGAFVYSNLENITIPDSVVFIDYYAFQFCDSLKSVIIPDSVKIVGHAAFDRCSSSPTIYCEATSLPLEWDSSWNGSGGKVVWGYNNEQ